MTTLKTKDFILRPVKKSDLKNFHKYRNDKVLAKNMSLGVYPLSIKQAKKELNYFIKASEKKDSLRFIIDINGSLIGAIWLMEIIPNFRARIGYWIGKDYRGLGIGTKSLKLITNYAFKKYKLKRITAHVAAFNIASAKALEKAGFKLEGILKKNRYKNKKYYDDFLYAKVK